MHLYTFYVIQFITLHAILSLFHSASDAFGWTAFWMRCILIWCILAHSNSFVSIQRLLHLCTVPMNLHKNVIQCINNASECSEMSLDAPLPNARHLECKGMLKKCNIENVSRCTFMKVRMHMVQMRRTWNAWDNVMLQMTNATSFKCVVNACECKKCKMHLKLNAHEWHIMQSV